MPNDPPGTRNGNWTTNPTWPDLDQAELHALRAKVAGLEAWKANIESWVAASSRHTKAPLTFAGNMLRSADADAARAVKEFEAGEGNEP